MFAHNKYYDSTDPDTSCLTPAKEIGCKFASADRVAEQLEVSSDNYKQGSCMALNAIAWETAMMDLNSWETGQHTIRRYQSRGRKLFPMPDKSAKSEADWIDGTMSIKDNSYLGNLQVSSLVYHTDLDNAENPGINDCKLISPARIVDYIMTDSLKESSSCQYTSSNIEEIFL